MNYSSITGEIVQRGSVKDLSNRDKINLYRDLSDALGLTPILLAHPDFTAKIDERIKEVWNSPLVL